MASSPFNNIAQLKSSRIATFSQLFSLNSHSHNTIYLPRKLRFRRSRSLHLSVYRKKNNSSSSPPSLCQLSSSVERNLCYLCSQRRHAFEAKNPEPEFEGDQSQDNFDHRLLLSCFLSFLHAFQRRKQSWEVFLHLIEVFGNNVEFVFKETLYDGLNIGVQWKFESEIIQVSLGKGFGFSISHSYKGKAMIRNCDTFIKPLLHLLPFRLKILASIEGLREGMDSFLAWESEDKSKKIFTILIAIVAITALFFLLRIPSFKLVLKLSHKR